MAGEEIKTPVTDSYEAWFSLARMSVEQRAVFNKMRQMERILPNAYEIAEWHIGDGDECGVKARALIEAIRKI